MERMVLVLLISCVASGQFIRFDDSFEDDSRESHFRPRPRTFLNRFDDSDEDFLRRDNRGRFSFGDSDEKFFRNGRRNSFDDSDEEFFGTNRNSFFRTNSNRSPFQTIPIFNRNPTFRPQNTFNRNTNFRRPLKIDSVEDLFEDLFDDDLDDRLRAQNTLAALGARSGNFRTSGFNQGIKPFTTRVGNNRFHSPSTRNSQRQRTFRSQSNQNQNALNHFSIKQHTAPSPSTVNRFKNGFSFGTTLGGKNNRFNNNRNRGTPLRNTFRSQRQQSPSNNLFRSSKRNSASPFNSIRKGSSDASKRSSSFHSPPGFNWPGGNGYYVSMSTGNSKPFTYFVKYDD